MTEERETYGTITRRCTPEQDKLLKEIEKSGYGEMTIKYRAGNPTTITLLKMTIKLD